MDMIHTLLLQLGNTERSPASEATFLRVIFLSLQENNPGCAANIRCSLFIANEKAGACNDHSAIARCSQLQQSIMTRNSLINKNQVTVMARIWEKRKPIHHCEKVNSHSLCINIRNVVRAGQRCLSTAEHWLLVQVTGIQFPAPTRHLTTM